MTKFHGFLLLLRKILKKFQKQTTLIVNLKCVTSTQDHDFVQLSMYLLWLPGNIDARIVI